MSISVDAQEPPAPKVPFWQTVGLAYSTYFDHFRDVLQISWLWILLLAPAAGAADRGHQLAAIVLDGSIWRQCSSCCV